MGRNQPENVETDGTIQMVNEKDYGLEVFMGTLVVGIFLAGVVTFIIRKMIKDKKNGKSLQCGGNCKHCSGCRQIGAEDEKTSVKL